MKTKKVFAAALAGLCAVGTMGVSAFADDATITEAGEKAYKISAGFQAPTIDVTVPTEIKGVINPYMIEVELDGVTAVAEGVASPRYAITNNSTEVGVKVNATYSADGLDGIVDAADKATDPAKNTKGQKLAFVTLNAALGTGADAEETVTMSTEEATKDELLKLTEKDGANDSGEIWLGGAVPETPAEKWTTKDKLTINVVLDLVPYNTGAAGGSTELGASGVTMTGTGGTYAITLGVTADSPAGKVITLTAPTGKTITNIVDTNSRNTVNVAAGTITLDTGIRAGDSSTITVTYDDASTATITLTINA